jgi:hypothetical protein
MKQKIIMMTCGLILVTIMLSGCAGTSIKRLTGSEFLEKAKHTDELNSFMWTGYIGSSHQRAYLEYGHPAFIGKGMSVMIFWTPLDELPNDIVSQIKAGSPPWTNWSDKIGHRATGAVIAPSAGSPFACP